MPTSYTRKPVKDMPVTKTAKRALRSSLRKKSANDKLLTHLETALRRAKKTKSKGDISTVFSLADRASKKKIIHKNKAARIKSQMSKLIPGKKSETKKPSTKKTAKRGTK